MLLKLDENLDVRLRGWLEARGHNVKTVSDEGIAGIDDQQLFERCSAERRTLLTLDLDFSNPLRFPPTGTAGTIVLRPPTPSISLTRILLEQAIDYAASNSPQSEIWIVEAGRVRIFRSWDEE